MIRISLVTVTFNAEQTLPTTLRSVAAQTYPQVEHILIDGLSKDGTFSLIQDYAQKGVVSGHTVKVLHERDKGLYDAMNKAFSLATGDYICFLNAGDSLPSCDTLERMVSAIEHDEQQRGAWPAVVYGDTNLVDGEGRFLRRRRLSPPQKLSWQCFKHGMLVCHQSFYARRDIAPRYDLRYRFSADFDWCIRVMKTGWAEGLHFLNVGMVLTNYLSEGMTTQNHRASLVERFCIMTRHYGWVSTVLQHLWFVVRGVVRR